MKAHDLVAINSIRPELPLGGHLAGIPMLCIYLQGCDVGCPWCNVPETWEAKESEILNQDEFSLDVLRDEPNRWGAISGYALAILAADLAAGLEWVLITGGEPGLQSIGPLVREIQARGLKVAVETSGTARGVIGSSPDWMIVSPKVGVGSGRPILGEVLRIADEIRYPISSHRDVENFDYLLRSRDEIQPEAIVGVFPINDTEAAGAVCLESCFEMGWRYSGWRSYETISSLKEDQ